MHALAQRQIAVQRFKRDHPLLVTMIILITGHYLIYKLSSIMVFILGLLLPILFIVLHASCRMRNITNKMTNVSHVLGFSKVTPMGFILESIGIEPNFKYN